MTTSLRGAAVLAVVWAALGVALVMVIALDDEGAGWTTWALLAVSVVNVSHYLPTWLHLRRTTAARH